MAIAPRIPLTPSAATAIGTRSPLADLRPVVRRPATSMQPLVIPTISFARPQVTPNPAVRGLAAGRQGAHTLITATGSRVGAFTASEHITGLTATPQRAINTLIRKVPGLATDSIVNIRKRLSI